MRTLLHLAFIEALLLAAIRYAGTGWALVIAGVGLMYALRQMREPA